MADVQIQQNPEKGGGANWAWAVVAIALIAVIAWFMLRSGGSDKSSVTVDTSAATPKAP